jgi:hypothetical protein
MSSQLALHDDDEGNEAVWSKWNANEKELPFEFSCFRLPSSLCVFGFGL